MISRRLLTIPAVFVMLPVAVATAPAWVVVGVAVDVSHRLFKLPTLRLLLFGVVYLVHEWIGLTAAALIAGQQLARRAVRRRRHERSTETLPYRRVQAWWTHSLYRWAGRLLGVRFELPDPSDLPAEPFILCSRHASMVDAILPALVITHRLERFAHYVLKRELMWDPTLDIFGHRLGNYFVARAGDGDAEAEAIARFADNALPDSVLVIFPEGTYATPKTKARVLASLERRESAEIVALARDLEHLLPPKPAGTLALLTNQPDLDVVVFGHVGLEGVAQLGGLRRRLPLEHPVVIRWWYHRREEIPVYANEQIAWLNERWRSLDGWVDSVKRVREPQRDARAAADRPTDIEMGDSQ